MMIHISVYISLMYNFCYYQLFDVGAVPGGGEQSYINSPST